MAELSGFMLFRGVETALPGWAVGGRLAFATGWTTVIFLLVALAMLPFGQWTAAAMREIQGPLRAYSLNVAGSLAGILLYTAATAAWLPPVVWFVPVALCCTLFVATSGERRRVLAVAVGLLLMLMPDDLPLREDTWSAYQKLTLVNRNHVVVNNAGYQTMDVESNAVVDRVSMPYLVRHPPGDVLIVGAGTGNDVAAALAAGARSVVAVEIDRAILQMGIRWHPQAPYRDPRVEVVIDDARHYLKTTGRRFDLIVFSHLDAHTVLSSYTNVRLDNYIYTVEAFREARARLAPKGMIYLSYFAQQPFISERLYRNLTTAFGHEPVSLDDQAEAAPQGWQCIQFLTGEADVRAALEPVKTVWPAFPPVDFSSSRTIPSTDRWPFLPLQGRQLPPLTLVVSAVILVLSAAFAWTAWPRDEAFDRRVFWLGAAFMLVEVHNVSRLALVFGTTWQVNAWVIGAVLVVILAANAVCAWLRRRGRAVGWPIALALFASLALAYAVPVDVFVRWGLPGAVAITSIMTLPVFFAGLVFADAFARSSSPSFALGWNVLGAVVGGMAENASYLIGIPGLLAVAAVFYALALAPRLSFAGQLAPARAR
jgi:spermidine synthase